ncbi:MAG: hypothetical protein ACD_37C00031G0011 [uncultured bacterium]|nr:MAG: hypothetical protein ACD_37C00031G0011 [uncultured bacterium]KKP95586.1 MAG: hypothetical protein US02_C0008G0008 [Candidatus Levybacteria bacterium GW2011_GWA2_36_13]KKQ00734.1 MAG: hypothetical protein US07_C0007G0005 [Candidatus Levybacteria bacterium GW2011_GWB1_36_18]KKQ58523.1 MAG: hypothetical protein US77_C0001G0009 [Microgenomates group bacterium GW2011_GWC1_38_14]KKR17541.1 MAG: hypothetical protein UT44_C0007G0007 [Candidatus Levybacteria bacterium GW2011_GWA1_39_32]OGH43805
MKVLITGGHLTPAIATIEALSDWGAVYVGRKYSMEADQAPSLEHQEIPRLGVKFIEVNPARIQRKFSRGTIPAVFRGPKGFLEAFGIIRNEKPDVVLCFGGYVQIPFVFAAYILRIPIILHEQTFEAGLSNKLSSKFAKFICISHESSRKYFPENKTILTGNPVRKEIFESDEKTPLPKGNDPLIFVTGGSQGSHFINELISNNLSTLLLNYRIIHQTGASEKFHDFESLKDKSTDKYSVYKFIPPNKIGYVLKNADLVIARGGANTIWELFLLKKKAIIIPLSFSQKQEQLKNANFLSEVGLAKILEEGDFSNSDFLLAVNDMIKSKEEFKSDISYPSNPSTKIVEVIENAIKTKNKKVSKKSS